MNMTARLLPLLLLTLTTFTTYLQAQALEKAQDDNDTGMQV